jgi:hypothetical protein
MSKRGSDDLKKLSALQATLVVTFTKYEVVLRRLTVFFWHKPHQKTALQKTSHDLRISLVAFQRAQQVSAERQRTVVEVVKQAIDDDRTSFVSNPFYISNNAQFVPFTDTQPNQRARQSNAKPSFFNLNSHHTNSHTKNP